MTEVEERIATFLWTQFRGGHWTDEDYETDLDRVLADTKAEQDFDDSPGDQSCGEAGSWENCCEIARALVAGKRLEDTRYSFAHVDLPAFVGPCFAITPTAYWKRQGFLYDRHFDIPDKRFVALTEGIYEFDGSAGEGRQALLALSYEEDELLKQFTESHPDEGEPLPTPQRPQPPTDGWKPGPGAVLKLNEGYEPDDD